MSNVWSNSLYEEYQVSLLVDTILSPSTGLVFSLQMTVFHNDFFYHYPKFSWSEMCHLLKLSKLRWPWGVKNGFDFIQVFLLSLK